jgi:serine/threonine protein kinase/tetratricopeptide (TPR) repeat protein
MPADRASVEAIFDEARTKPAGAERSAFLDQACGNDPELRRRVERLLAAHASAGSFLSVPDADPSDPSKKPDSPYVALREGPGSRIGRYRLLQQIGEGAFGVVFMAEQEHPVRRKVALKIIKLGVDTKQVVARFEAERQALAMMDHPGIAKVLDADATETGRPYFVMELVNGVPITDYCDKNSLTIPQRLALFEQVCQAVQHAHQKGLIHRDIKPSNVLVSTQDDKPLAKVIDFGVAKATQARLTEKTLFTEFRQLVGTPEYMSPEQAEGSIDIDTRCDVYSLGVLLYQLLTGSPPFDPKELRSMAFAEIQRIIREVDPPPPSTRLSTAGSLASVAAQRGIEPKKLHSMIRGELDWIVMKCLEKDRKRRYATASGLAADVLRYLADEPVSANPPSAGYRMRKFVRKYKGPVIASVAVLLALIAGMIGTTIGLIGQSRQRALAEQQRIEAVKQRDEAQHNLGLLLYFAQNLPEAETHLRKLLDEEKKNGFAPAAHTGTELYYLARTLQDQRKLDDAEATYDQALRTYRAVLSPEDPHIVMTLQSIGILRQFRGRNAESEPPFREEIDLIRRARPNSHQELGMALYQLAFAVRDQGRLEEAESLFRQTITEFKAAFPEPDWHMGNTLKGYGELLSRMHRFPEAEAKLREAEPILSADAYMYLVPAYVELYTTWNSVDPGKGYDAKAASWRSKLPATRPSTAEASVRMIGDAVGTTSH